MARTVKPNEYGVITSCPKDVKEAVIPSGVTAIGERAFDGCTALASVEIPEGVTKIGERAFKGCTALASVVIPDSVTGIGERAFKGCTALASVVIPDSVTAIGGGAFSGCTALASVVIPEGVTEIGSEAFYGCTALASVVIPEGVTEIGWGAFDGCKSLTSVEIPSSVTEIGGSAFAGCESLSSVSIPSSVTEIGEEAFKGCNINELSHPCLTIKGGVAIKDGKVQYCASQAREIVIPEGVTEIGEAAFKGCTSLAAVEFGGTMVQWDAVKGKDNLFNGNVPATGVKCADGEWQKPVVLVEDGVAVKCLDKSASSVEIPSGVTAIGERAFYGCTALASVVIPASVTAIYRNAFYGCKALASVVIPESVTEIGWYAFGGCTSLASVVIPEGVTEIDKYAFGGCDAVESITSASPLFPFNEKTRKLYDATGKTKKVILVANAAKEEAKQEKIEKVQLASAGAVLDSIVQAHPVTNVQVRKEEKECFIVIPAKDGGMELCLANSKVQKWMQTLPVLLDKAANNATAAELREYAKANDLPDASRKYITVSKEGSVKLKKNAEPVYLVIPDGVTEIGYKAFRDCKSLSSVVIPESVKLIDSSAFRGCESLASIKIGAGVRTIGCSAFSGCKALASVVIPASVTEIDGAFIGCKSLASVEFGGTMAQWEAVKKWVDWHGDVPAKSVKCADGEARL